MQKRYPKRDQNGLRKRPQKGTKIIQMCSQSLPRAGSQRNIDKLWFGRDPFLTIFWIAKKTFSEPKRGQIHSRTRWFFLTKKKRMRACSPRGSRSRFWSLRGSILELPGLNFQDFNYFQAGRLIYEQGEHCEAYINKFLIKQLKSNYKSFLRCLVACLFVYFRRSVFIKTGKQMIFSLLK